MALKTPEEYKESLRDGRVVYIDGEKVDDVTTHPKLKTAVETAAFDYEMAEMPEFRDLAVVDDEKTGEPISRYFHRPKNGDDLLKRHELMLTASRLNYTTTPFAREMIDSFNGCVVTAYSLGTLLLYGQSVSIAGSDAPAAQLRLAGARELGILAGVALGAMGPQLLGFAFPDAGGYPAFACAAAALAIVAAWASRPLWRRPVALNPPPNLGALLRSGAGWVLTLGFVNGLPVAVTTTLFLFFVDQRLGLSHLAGAFLVLFFAAGGLSAPAWARAATRYGPRPVLAGAMCLAIASFVWAYALPSGAGGNTSSQRRNTVASPR